DTRTSRAPRCWCAEHIAYRAALTARTHVPTRRAQRFLLTVGTCSRHGSRANDFGMRTPTVLVSAAALLMLVICASCGSGGGGGSAGDGDPAPNANAASSVAVTWSGSDGAAGYVVHWGTTSGDYSHDVDVKKPVD